MAREKIKDWQGRVLGETEQIGTKLWLFDFYGRRLGYYDSANNTTYDWHGRRIGTGNIVMTLLR